MAFQLSLPLREAMMHPSSRQVSLELSDELESNPIAEVFFPNVEQE